MRIGWAIVAAAACAACSGNKTSGDADASASADLPHQIAAEYCGALATCCGAAGFAYDPASCNAQMVAQWQTTLDATKRPTIKLDAAKLAACRAEMVAIESSCGADAGVDDAGHDPVTVACFGVVNGTVPPGGPCTVPQECATTSLDQFVQCDPDPDPASPTFGKGFCVLVDTHAGPGASCEQTDPTPANPHLEECDPALAYCDFATHVCTTYIAEGASCAGATGAQCAPTAFCDTTMATPTCRARVPAGGSCLYDAGINYGACTADAYCDVASGSCVALKPAGAPCTANAQCTNGSTCLGFDDGGFIAGGVCYSYVSLYDYTPYAVNPRTCGFGPGSSGPDDAGIASP